MSNAVPSKLRASMSIEQIKYKINSYLIKEYGPNCNNKYKYSYQITENLIYNKGSHLVSEFKDKMIMDFIDEFLKRFYNKGESFQKIPQYSEFYINYQKYFCIPTFRVKFFNKKIHQQREKKAKNYYNEKFQEKDSDSISENNIGIGAISMDGTFDIEKIYYKNFKEKNNKTFFNKEVEKVLEKESISNINQKSNTLSIHESGSKIKNNNSHLLNTISNEESLCDIMNCLNKEKLFEIKNNTKNNKDLFLHKDITKSILNKKKMNINSNSMNNNVKLVIKKRVINFKNNNNRTNNYETSEFNNTKKPGNVSTNIIKHLGAKNFKIFLNNKDHEKNVISRKIKKANSNNKANKHIKSQDNLLSFLKNKKATRNLSYFSLYKKKSLPTSKNNISTKVKKNTYVQNKIQNKIQNIFISHIKDFVKNSYYSKDKIRNMKKISFRPIRISKSNVNIINLGIKNQNESLLNIIKKRVIQKKAKKNDKVNMKKTGENFRKNKLHTTYYNSAKRAPNDLTVHYKNINSNKENNFLTNNHFLNNNKFDFKYGTNSYNSKSKKPSKSPLISEFSKFINTQNLQKNYQTLERKSNNIQNLNININNQINIRLNSNINEMQNVSLNNNNNNKIGMKLRTKNKHKNKSIDFNTNLNFQYKTFFSNNNKIMKIKIFPNNNLMDINLKNKGNRNKKKFIFHKDKSNNNSSTDDYIKKYNNVNTYLKK